MSTSSEDGGASRSRHDRWRVLAIVAILALLVGVVLYVGYKPASGGYLTASPDVRIDGFPTNASSDPQGVEPSVAIAPNGTIGVAWIRFDPIVPTLYFTPNASFTTQIWYAASYDGGISYSSPQLVSGGGTECVDPSIAYSPNGTVLIAYLCTPSFNHSVMLAYERPGDGGFTNLTVDTEVGLDRPWLALSPDGVIDIAFTNQYGYPMLVRAPLATLAFSMPIDLVSAQGMVASLAIDPSGALDVGIRTSWGVSFARWSGGSSPVQVAASFVIQTYGSLGTQAAILSQPGPGIAATSQPLYLVYTANDDTTLVLRSSVDGGENWSSAIVVENSSAQSIEMPGIAASPTGDSVLITWRDGVTGYWNTYARAYSPATGTLSPLIRVSSLDGYPSAVRSWHGDFLGVAFLPPDRACIAWSDGRGGISPDVGFGHVYATVVTIHPAAPASLF